MGVLGKILPRLSLPESPTGELATLALRQARAENAFAVHVAFWLAASVCLVSVGLVVGEGVVPFVPISLVWAAVVAVHGFRARVAKRYRFESLHRALLEEHRSRARAAAREGGVGRLREKLIRAAEEARRALRSASPELTPEVSRGEAEALALVAWLDEAEGLLERHRVDPRLRREVAEELSEPKNRDARESLERLLATLDLHDSRLAVLEREAAERRSRVDGFLLAVENVKIAHSGGGVVPAVSASVRQRIALLGEGDEVADRRGPGGAESAKDAADRIREEVRLARDLQRSILPGDAPRLPGLSVAHTYSPSSEVGGDFYDFYAPSSSRLLVALGDASGHGLDSSMISSMAKSALYMQMSAGRDLVGSMNEINRMMCDTLGRRRFMSLALLELDVEREKIAWVNAGQVYPLLARGGRVRELEQPGYPLGVRRESSYLQREESLEPGDLLVLLTDGYVEAVDAAGDPHGWQRLVERLRGLDGAEPQQVIDRLAADLAVHLGPSPPQDDVTLIAIRFAP